MEKWVNKIIEFFLNKTILDLHELVKIIAQVDYTNQA